jgi:hypothetical protein
MLLFRAAPKNPVKAYREATGAGLLVRAINQTRKMYVTPGAGAVRIAVSNWCTGLGTIHEEGKEKSDFDVVAEVLLSVVESPPPWATS